MIIFGFVFAVVALVLIGVGLAVGFVACLVTAGLLGLGIISSSFLVGLRTGRPVAALQALILQCGVLGGLPAGAVCAWLGQTLIKTYGGGWPILIYGALGGAAGGLVLALILGGITRRATSWAEGRWLTFKD